MSDLIIPGTATPSQVLTGQTFSAGTNYNVNGTMPNNGAVIVTPSTANQTIAAGYHNGSGIVQGDVNLIAINILSGKSIFGVAGSAIGGNNASGSVTVSSTATVTVSGLSFNPKFVYLTFFYSPGSRNFYAQYQTLWSPNWTLNWTSDSSSGTTLDGSSASITLGTGGFSFSIPNSSYTGYNVTWLAVA